MDLFTGYFQNEPVSTEILAKNDPLFREIWEKWTLDQGDFGKNGPFYRGILKMSGEFGQN